MATFHSPAQTRRLLAAVTLVLAVLSVTVFAAVSATGDRQIVGYLGPAGPFLDLHHGVTRSLMKTACWLAVIAGGTATLAGLAAVRRGWRPRWGFMLAACALATVVFVFVPPAASIDVQNYAEYGRIVVLGHSPWVMTPQQLYLLRDPVGLIRPAEWRNQPTVYGPVATAVEAAAAWLGGTSMAWIAFWIKVANGLSYLAVAVVLDRLAGQDPARRARAAVLWTLNPLMLFWLVAGAHADLLAVLPLVLALWVLRTPLTGRATFAAGALAGIAIAVKVTFVAPAAGLAAGLWHAVDGRRRTTTLAAGVAGTALVLAVGYTIAGTAAVRSLSQRLSSANDSFLPLPAFVYDHSALYTVALLAAFAVIAGLLAWRMPPGYADAGWIRPMAICALAVVLGDIVQYPWYDAMFFPLLALLPASRMDAWLVARLMLISGFILPGIGVRAYQYREVRVVVPVFLVVFLVALALGKLRGGAPEETARPGRSSEPISLPR